MSRGDKVLWWSDYRGDRVVSKAVFVKYDDLGFPRKDVILAIKIGDFVHSFRWPVRLTQRVAR